MGTRSLEEPRTRVGKGDLGLLFSVIVGVAVLAFQGDATSGATDAFLAVLAWPVVLLMFRASAPERILPFCLTPTGLLLTFLWGAVLSTPVLWALGFAEPWPTYPRDESTFIFATAVASVGLLHLGCLAAGAPHSQVPGLRSPSGVARMGLFSLALLVVSFTILSAQTGGIGFLIQNLLNKREILAGLGPLTALSATAAVAAIAIAQMERPSRAERLIGWACGGGYLGFLFIMGSRFPMVAFVLAIVVSRSIHARTPKLLLGALLGALIPFSVWYSVSVRKGQVVEQSGEGLRESLRIIITPFAHGGLDVLHTHGVVIVHSPPAWNFDAALLSHNITTMVPRFIWPSKPPGFSVEFSKQYFASSWLGGSGVPPSISAEFLHIYGVVGAVVALVALGYGLTRVGSWLRHSDRTFLRLFYPFFAVDCIVLAKSGSDAFLQQISIHLAAIVILLFAASVAGVKVKVGNRA